MPLARQVARRIEKAAFAACGSCCGNASASTEVMESFEIRWASRPSGMNRAEPKANLECRCDALTVHAAFHSSCWQSVDQSRQADQTPTKRQAPGRSAN